MRDGLPASVADIVERLSRDAAVYGYLKWNEQAKLKADMMNTRARWLPVRVSALREKCLSAGLSEDDTSMIVDWLKKVQDGRRLIPKSSYRSYAFPAPAD